MTAHTAFIALGSNMGDRRATLRAALDAIDRLDGSSIERISSIIETPPMGQPGQEPYLNAAACLRTELSPRALLDHFLKIEAAHGRTRSEQTRWGARQLDIDLLLYDEQVIDEPGLTVPHPYMHERLFVLEPLAEIAPQIVHPVSGRSIVDLLDQVRSSVTK